MNIQNTDIVYRGVRNGGRGRLTTAADAVYELSSELFAPSSIETAEKDGGRITADCVLRRCSESDVPGVGLSDTYVECLK